MTDNEQNPMTPQQALATAYAADPSWSYLFVHRSKIRLFADRMERDGIRTFVHTTVTYQRSKNTKGIETKKAPTLSGLLFVQGQTDELQRYLDHNFSTFHLVNDCATHRPAVISHARMVPFMRIAETDPDRIRFLLHSFEHYAKDNTLLRITSGPMAGMEGYIVRIDRDRRLVMRIGTFVVAVSGIYSETFEPVV